ncbi:MAG: 3-deoxy-7-phosphoheptulonate synthase [Oscillospiraceae bacterium]|jgi:3-deoxy-7-phosphoheptulonate synthase|nr:3-deoxy-7-phosphoheptulonate synthase [Oscillospiraceae bacterium]
MVLVLRDRADADQVDYLKAWLKTMGVETRAVVGNEQTIMGLIGDTSRIDMELLQSLDIVESVRRIQEPYKSANRKFHPDDTVVRVGDASIGGGGFAIIAGPCSVETEAQVVAIARAVKDAGAAMLRGGAFKPRTSPYAFQGLRAEGIELLLKAKEETGLPVVSEVMDISQLPLFEHVDVIQVGARNMQNFELLKELGQLRKPVLIKRGLANTLQELLMSAEYVMAGGNPNIILCERGIRTFETETRNTLDLSAVPVLREKTHLPVIVDPSHATGVARWVPALSLAAAAVGADGLIVEVHNDPKHALCDGAQSLTPEMFSKLAERLRGVHAVGARSF